jgi:penicillin-binding protein 2
MQEGLLSPFEPIDCPAEFVLRKPDGTPILGGTFSNWNDVSSGSLTLAPALEQSCDTYFYDIGMRFYNQEGSPLQEWAARWGFGQPTGLDIGDEDPGLLPTPAWRRKTYSNAVDKLWKPGDSIQLAIGQKDLLVTPLQMASFYAMIANGGRIVRPHLLLQVEEPGTERASPLVRRRYVGPPAGEGRIDASSLAAVQEGLFGATHGSNGTASIVFRDFPIPVAGKTGTAEKIVPEVNRYAYTDQSWFCGYGPTDREAQIALCVLIENGGFGGEAAAPAALTIFQHFFRTDGGNLTPVAAD